MHRTLTSWLCVLTALLAVGCQSTRTRVASTPAPPSQPHQVAVAQVAYEPDLEMAADPPQEEQQDDPSAIPTPAAMADTDATAEPVAMPRLVEPPTVADLANSVRLHFPLIEQAVAARTIASGEMLAAQGAFDHKLEGYSNAQPLDYYENYRQSLGVKRDTYWGGQVFSSYRIGRGAFEPWYLERETNKGGEFKTGFVVPIARDRTIDENRAELWRSQIERGRVEPEIRAVIIAAVRDATVVYWQWVAATANYQVAESVLELGLERKSYLERQVELGEKADIDLVDNRRIILSRSAKATDAKRKLEQAAVKLSLFWRDDQGNPIVLPADTLTAAFPANTSVELWGEEANVLLAQANRPELEELQLAKRQLAVLLRQACNETLPQVDAGLLVAQDVGEPTSSKRDKSEFEVEASLMLSVPLERRKALGKARQLRGKIAQLTAKTQLAADKITIEAQIAHAALTAAATRVDQSTEGLELARRMQAAEQRLYELGQSTLFNLNLREQQAAEAAVELVAAQFDYQVALADYAAALGFDSVEELASINNES